MLPNRRISLFSLLQMKGLIQRYGNAALAVNWVPVCAYMWQRLTSFPNLVTGLNVVDPTAGEGGRHGPKSLH